MSRAERVDIDARQHSANRIVRRIQCEVLAEIERFRWAHLTESEIEAGRQREAQLIAEAERLARVNPSPAEAPIPWSSVLLVARPRRKPVMRETARTMLARKAAV